MPNIKKEWLKEAKDFGMIYMKILSQVKVGRGSSYDLEWGARFLADPPGELTS